MADGITVGVPERGVAPWQSQSNSRQPAVFHRCPFVLSSIKGPFLLRRYGGSRRNKQISSSPFKSIDSLSWKQPCKRHSKQWPISKSKWQNTSPGRLWLVFPFFFFFPFKEVVVLIALWLQSLKISPCMFMLVLGKSGTECSVPSIFTVVFSHTPKRPSSLSSFLLLFFWTQSCCFKGNEKELICTDKNKRHILKC